MATLILSTPSHDCIPAHGRRMDNKTNGLGVFSLSQLPSTFIFLKVNFQSS
jgi:hypothetical protein